MMADHLSQSYHDVMMEVYKRPIVNLRHIPRIIGWVSIDFLILLGVGTTMDRLSHVHMDPRTCHLGTSSTVDR